MAATLLADEPSEARIRITQGPVPMALNCMPSAMVMLDSALNPPLGAGDALRVVDLAQAWGMM
jgi:hypothetical protein